VLISLPSESNFTFLRAKSLLNDSCNFVSRSSSAAVCFKLASVFASVAAVFLSAAEAFLSIDVVFSLIFSVFLSAAAVLASVAFVFLPAASVAAADAFAASSACAFILSTPSHLPNFSTAWSVSCILPIRALRASLSSLSFSCSISFSSIF